MTKKHLEAIAEILKNARLFRDREIMLNFITRETAEYAKSVNPVFKEDKFYEAADHRHLKTKKKLKAFLES